MAAAASAWKQRAAGAGLATVWPVVATAASLVGLHVLGVLEQRRNIALLGMTIAAAAVLVGAVMTSHLARVYWASLYVKAWQSIAVAFAGAFLLVLFGAGVISLGIDEDVGPVVVMIWGALWIPFAVVFSVVRVIIDRFHRGTVDGWNVVQRLTQSGLGFAGALHVVVFTYDSTIGGWAKSSDLLIGVSLLLIAGLVGLLWPPERRVTAP